MGFEQLQLHMSYELYSWEDRHVDPDNLEARAQLVGERAVLINHLRRDVMPQGQGCKLVDQPGHTGSGVRHAIAFGRALGAGEERECTVVCAMPQLTQDEGFNQVVFDACVVEPWVRGADTFRPLDERLLRQLLLRFQVRRHSLPSLGIFECFRRSLLDHVRELGQIQDIPLLDAVPHRLTYTVRYRALR